MTTITASRRLSLSSKRGTMCTSSPRPHRKGHAWSYGQITRLVEPRSCVIRTSSGEVRRNRAQVRMAAPPPRRDCLDSGHHVHLCYTSVITVGLASTCAAVSVGEVCNIAISARDVCVIDPAVQPTVSSRCDPPQEAQTPQSSLQSSVCASGDSSQKSLSQMAPYKTRSGRVVKSPKVFDPSDNV